MILDENIGWTGLDRVEEQQQPHAKQRKWGKTIVLLIVLIPVIGIASCVALGVGGVLFMGAKDARLKPQLPARFAEADALAHAGKWSEAKSLYDDLVNDLTFSSLSSDRARALAGQAVCLLMLARDDEAREVFERAFERQAGTRCWLQPERRIHDRRLVTSPPPRGGQFLVWPLTAGRHGTGGGG